MSEPRPPFVTEAAFMTSLVDYAHLRGWLVHHCRPAQSGTGTYSTPIQGDAGFPDVVLARMGEVLFLEIKTSRGQITQRQQHWADNLGTSWHLVRTNEWARVRDLLA